MGVNRADPGGFLVHHVRKSLHAPCDVYRDGCARVISRGKHKPIEKLLQGEHIPRLNAGESGSRLCDHRVLRHRHLVGKISVFESHKSCHNFGCAGGIQPFKGILAVEDFTAILVKKRCRLRGHKARVKGLFVRHHTEILGKRLCIVSVPRCFCRDHRNALLKDIGIRKGGCTSRKG